MAIQIKTTDTVTMNGCKTLVYGASGVGKTTLNASLIPWHPIIFSAEAGLLPLRKLKIPYIEIRNYKDLEDTYRWAISSPESKNYWTYSLDSISEIAETILAVERGKTKDPRQAYGETLNQTMQIIRNFRDLQGKHVYFSCKEEYVKDEATGAMLYQPMMPGRSLSNSLPYLFDEVYRMQAIKNPANGEIIRSLATRKTHQYVAKTRIGETLAEFEVPDLNVIFQKLLA